MKFASSRLCLVVAGAALLLGGCLKKPARPDPSATAMGPQNGTNEFPRPIEPITTDGLTPRGPEDFDPSGRNVTTLQAQTVYFDFDSSTIKPSERPKLQAVKEYLDKNPGFRLVLEGHCDWRGTAEYNLSLGDRRAGEAKKYLQTLGAPADKVEASSKGSLDAAKNADEATMAKDRRVDIVVVKVK